MSTILHSLIYKEVLVSPVPTTDGSLQRIPNGIITTNLGDPIPKPTAPDFHMLSNGSHMGLQIRQIISIRDGVNWSKDLLNILKKQIDKKEEPLSTKEILDRIDEILDNLTNVRHCVARVTGTGKTGPDDPIVRLFEAEPATWLDEKDRDELQTYLDLSKEIFQEILDLVDSLDLDEPWNVPYSNELFTGDHTYINGKLVLTAIASEVPGLG